MPIGFRNEDSEAEGPGGRLRLTSQQLAESAYRVWQSIIIGGKGTGWVGEPPGLELMPPDIQECWSRVGQHSESLLAQLASHGSASATYSEAGYQVMVLYLDRDHRTAVIARALWAGMSESARLAWEAVARHLALVLNSDELGSLEEAEAIWPAWASKKQAETPEGSSV